MNNQDNILTTNPLYKAILDKINQQQLTHSDIVKAMNYRSKNSQNKAVKRLKQVLSSADLGLIKTCYDFKYSSIEFINALCKVLTLKISDYQTTLNQLIAKADKFHTAQTPVIIADISFNENFVPSFMSVMAMAKFIHIYCGENLRLLDRAEQMPIIKERITQHYQQMTGNIPYDGVINGYRVIFDSKSNESVYIDK